MEIIVLGILVLAQLALLVFCVVFIVYFSSAFITWPPSIPTDRKSRRRMLEEIKAVYPTEANIKIADLGSGYGHLLRDLARSYKNASITGVELLWLPYLGGKLLCKRFKNINVVKDDILKHDLSPYDVIVYFFRSDHGLDKKFQEEFKGKLVISNNFPLHYKEADKIIEMKETFVNRKLFIYHF